MRHLANAQYWDRPAGGNTGRLFLAFGGPVCADRISYCPLDRKYLRNKIQNGHHFWGDKNFCQDHCRGVYLPPSIKAEEIAFPRYSQFFIFVCESSPKSR